MSDHDAPFDLMRDEEVLLFTRPHPLSMLSLELFWVFIAALGVGFLLKRGDLAVSIQDLIADDSIRGRLKEMIVGSDSVKYMSDRAYDAIWIGGLLLFLVVMSVFRINFGYVVVLLLLIAGKVFVFWKAKEVFKLEFEPNGLWDNYLLIAVGLIGVVGVEIFRRGHRYYLTSHRIVARFGVLATSERATLYSKIDDLILQKTILGSILGFGTVIPVTSSGLGMGQDLAIAGASVGAAKAGAAMSLFAAGAKAKNVPRELSFYVLYRVPGAEAARNIITEEMTSREPERRKPRPQDRDEDEDGDTQT